MNIPTNLTIMNKYKEYLLDSYDNFPHGRYVSLIIIRKTESETIFRTEGSGEGLSKEIVTAGKENSTRLRRVVISKRKQTAVERRTGRELLREHHLLRNVVVNKEERPCALNTNAPCGKCIDCMLYGYAVGGGGAQKSRVMTDDAYSIAPVSQVTAKRTFNATFDNSTMRNPLTGAASTSINEDEYVLPETHFLDIETLKDVTVGELQYVIGNILRSSRYGAISSRLGRVRNTLVAMIFSDTELFSNLELTQYVYDILLKGSDQEPTFLDSDKLVETAIADKARKRTKELPFPLSDQAIKEAIHEASDKLLKRIVGRVPVVVRDAVLEQVVDETIALYRDNEQLLTLLQAVEKEYEKGQQKSTNGTK